MAYVMDTIYVAADEWLYGSSWRCNDSCNAMINGKWTGAAGHFYSLYSSFVFLYFLVYLEMFLF